MNKPRIGVVPYYHYEENHEYMPEGYTRAVDGLGGEMIPIHYDTAPSALKTLVAGLDAVIFSGGVDVDPARYGQEKSPACGQVHLVRDEMEFRLFDLTLAAGLPILGICRGIQLLNVAFGGTLIQDIPTAFPGAQHQQDAPREALSHEVRLVPASLLGQLYNGAPTLLTNSFHHQAILTLASSLELNATAAEGFPEAFTARSPSFVLGVQWHPEISYHVDENSRKIFELFSRYF